MRLLTCFVAALCFSAASYANDGKIIGPVLVLGTALYDHDANGGTPDVMYGQILLDESHATWNDDADGDSDTFGDDCAVSMYFASNLIDLSTDGGKAMYQVLVSAQQGAATLAVIIDYNEDANDNCIVQTVLVVPQSAL